MRGLKALIPERIYFFNTSYPDISKRILLNWLQHYERCRNGSLQKICSLFPYCDNLCTPFLGWDLEFCCFCHRDIGFYMCHELDIVCQIYCKKKREKHFPLCCRKLCWYKIGHSAFPFSYQSLPCRERLTFCTLSLLQCCSHRRNTLQGKPSAAKTQDKGETTKPLPVLSPTLQGQLLPSKLWPTKWRRLGTMLRKAPFPRENLLSPFQSVQTQVLQLFLIFPLWEAAQHLQSALAKGRKLLKGKFFA